MTKTLVAFFSASGTTAKLANNIAKIVDADIFEIKPEVPYTEADLNWMDKNSRSSIEMADKSSRPTIKEKISNIEDYNTIFLGFPIWWYVAPTIISTFLESYDFSDKIIIPFATSDGSGMGNTDEELKKVLTNERVTWKKGKLLNNVSTDDIKSWLETIK